MDQKEANELAAGGKGLLHLGGRTFLVGAPDDEASASLVRELRRLAKAKMKSPLQSVMEDFASLSPQAREMAVAAAVRVGGKSQAEPDPDFVRAQIYEPEGASFLAWLLARKDDPSLQLEWVLAAVRAASPEVVLMEIGRASGLDQLAPNSSGQPSSGVGRSSTAPASTGG